MKYTDELSPRDLEWVDSKLKGFVPAEVFDIHAHPYHPGHFAPGRWSFLEPRGPFGCVEHARALRRYMPCQTLHGLYFGLPHRSADREAENCWVAGQIKTQASPLSRALWLAAPEDNREHVAKQLRDGRCCGLKVYHCYAARPDTFNARVSEFAPEWMWELVDEISGVLMLHIVRDGAITDPDNQADLRRLCRAYPKARLVLAHVARSFNYRHARAGLRVIADLENAVVDTSAICETEALRAALEYLGPRRILWGSDFPISEARGRCVTTGNGFYWLHPPTAAGPAVTSPDAMTLIGIESLLCLREACEDHGLTRGDLEDIFLRNSLRLLSPHLPSNEVPAGPEGARLWQQARQVIAGGTGLFSKRAERFEARGWPAYFSRCSGCEVWDLAGRSYLDLAGGIGAVLLGYADPEVTAAIRRRLTFGTYCSLVSPQEVELAEALLALHPWAGKVRYARGGGEAMSVAVRIARAATGRSGVAFCGYHGWHDWYLAANLGESDALDGHLLPGLEPKGVPRELRGTAIPFRYNDAASLEVALQKLGGNLAAVVMEPMRSQMPEDNFVGQAAAKCRAAGGVFVVDEVSSGLRYGFPGALSRFGIEPDVVVYAKAMGNGFPFGVIIGRDEIMHAAEASFISSSYWTDGVGPAAALAVLEKTQRLGVQKIVWQRGVGLQSSLRAVALRHPACRLVIGGMPPTPTLTFDLGLESRLAQTIYTRKMRQRGFLVSSVLYLMLAHEAEALGRFLDALETVLSEMDQVIESGKLAVEAGPTSTSPGFARLA